MAATRHCPSWTDLQPELLTLVLRRLPSLADRIRLAAVCRPWHHSARLEPLPPPFPWLTLRDGTFLSVSDGKIHSLPLVQPDNFRCIGSVGNWLLLEQRTGDGASLLMNPFSKDVVHLPDAETIWCHSHRPVDGYRSPYILLKLVLLSSMDVSPDSVFAILITNCKYQSVISICQPSTASAFRVLDHDRICDVAFVDGKLYALAPRKLFVLEVESSSKCKPKISSMKCIANDVIHQTVASEKSICMYFFYLVESSGRLLHVTRLVGGFLSLSPGKDRTKFCRTFSFDVFEVDLTTSSTVQWRRLNSLEGEALFVGPYSKALHASEYGVQADCIYFMCDYGGRDCPADPFRDSGVFNITNGTITPLLPETIMQVPEGIAKGCSIDKFYAARPSWFFVY
ncbi:uncharacterized protein LOC8070862 [Sorghum bicolor]|nr:uncharacterized protein LOC8070862 [Sorghum bicolor]|eukprot:XP_002436524.1 uncharacterized protein LOC8070862 [Sorghum bicolor]